MNAVVNIRGCSGAGKTTLVRRLMEAHGPAVPIVTPGTGRVEGHQIGPDLRVVGDYQTRDGLDHHCAGPIVDRLAREYARFGSSQPRATGRDWPDCEGKNATGSMIAFEVTELVDAQALSHGSPPRPWSDEGIVARISDILKKKDRRGFGAPNAERVLVIHTDELYLDPPHVEGFLRGYHFALVHRNVTRAFLLFGYSPRSGRCPYVELQLGA